MWAVSGCGWVMGGWVVGGRRVFHTHPPVRVRVRVRVRVSVCVHVLRPA